MEAGRDFYLKQLIAKKNNGLIKVITGIRRCGKSYLLFELYYRYLIGCGVEGSHIIRLSLDDAYGARYRNPLELDQFIRNKVSDNDGGYYVFIDEIQFVKEIENPWLPGTGDKIGFVDVLLGLMKLPNVDIYITGSNSKMLSSEIVTQFRDKGDIIHIYPLSYSEICRVYGENSEEVWNNFFTYGGMPRLLALENAKDKKSYLSGLFENTYMKDVLERHQIKNDKSVLDDLIKIIASDIGALTNPRKISDTFKSRRGISISQNTVDTYLDYFIEAFILSKAFRYDIKGRKYIGTPMKYYFSDIGLRNALLEFRQQEENHIMENILYNELIIRGYSVDVGVVEYRYKNETGKEVKSQLEVDFVAKNENHQIYVQSALHIDSPEKRKQETASLERIPDFFKKIVVVKDQIIPWTDEKGINYVGIREFLSGNYVDMEEI